MSAWTTRRILLLGILGAIAAVSVTAGVRYMNARAPAKPAMDTTTPEQRDTRRFEDLQAILDAAHEAQQKTGTVPETLDGIRAGLGRHINTADPYTFQIYEYHVVDGRRAEACAEFEVSDGEQRRKSESERETPAEKFDLPSRECFQTQLRRR